LLAFSLTAYAQVVPSPPTVYVSGGPNIYSVTVATGAVKAIFTSPNGANFESLAIGPDNADAAHPFLLYACDTATNSIIRLDPTAAAIAAQSVASGLAFPPMCGRSTATGDFYVTSKSGPGVYQLIYPANSTPPATPLANVPFGATPLAASATQIDTFANMQGRGIAQKPIGDLLVVDNAGNQVLRSVYPSPAQPPAPPTLFSTLKELVNKNLNGPVGVVNAPSLSQIFVSNSNSTASKANPAQPAVSIFNAADGTPSAAPCPSLSIGKSSQVPGFLATGPTDQFSNTVPNQANKLITDTIYLVTSANSSGTLWTWNTVQGNCNLVPVATAKAPLSGVAISPAGVTLTLPVVASVPKNFLFNSNLFQLTTTQNCTNNPPTATVTAWPFSLATVSSMITLAAAPHHQTPSVNLGDGGFETIYESYNPQCGAAGPNNDTAVMLVSNFVDPSQSTNARYLDCHNADPNTEPNLVGGTACQVALTLGSYPVGGPIKGDYGGKLSNFFAMVNETPAGVPGQFCGFQSPLSGDGTTLPPTQPPPNPLTGNSITVKFKVADLSQGGTCQSGPYLNGQTAVISVAQVCNTTASNPPDPFCGPGGSPVFNAIDVNNNATSSQPAVFTNTNNQFKFSLMIGGYASGTYSLSVTFLTDNTTTQTTLFSIP
jgi:hypothetical protein